MNRFSNLLLLVSLLSLPAWSTSYRITSVYPDEAIQKCIEGWVLVEYTVLTDGTTVNHKVIDSSPKGIFDKSALKSAKKLNYAHQPEALGKRTDGVQFKYTFNLDRGSPAYAHCK